jgi:hypothetical protein
LSKTFVMGFASLYPSYGLKLPTTVTIDLPEPAALPAPVGLSSDCERAFASYVVIRSEFKALAINDREPVAWRPPAGRLRKRATNPLQHAKATAPPQPAMSMLSGSV